LEEIKSVQLPAPLLDSIENPFADIRLGAVQHLTKILNGKNLGLARSAREALERIAAEDDSRQVSRAAAQALESVRASTQADANSVAEVIKKDGWQIVNERAEKREEQRANVKDQRLAKQKREVPLADNPGMVSRTETEESAPFTTQQAILWLTLGCAIGGLLGGYVYSEIHEVVGGAIGGAIVGLVTALVFRAKGILSDHKNLVLIGLFWASAGAIGWWIGWGALSDAGGAGIGITIFALSGLTATLDMDYIRSKWQSIAIATAAWGVGGIIGWAISKGLLINQLGVEDSSGWAIGSAIGWALGGYVLGWQLPKGTKKTSQEQFEDNQGIPEFIEKHKVFLLSWKGRSLIGVIVGLILGILYGVLYGIIHDISYDFAYAYSTFYGDVPHIFLLIICGFAGFVAYPHKVTIWLMTGCFMVVAIAKSQDYLLYDLIAFGGVYGLPAGALISRILYWLKVLK
jgi:MFS family permease